MKKFVPLKYVLGMIALFVIIPISIFLVIIFTMELSNFAIAICMFLVGLVIFGPYVYYVNQENASIVIQDNRIINYMNDGTLNFGWSEDINDIKRIELVNSEEVKKYYKNCKSKKALLIDFGSYNVKYISVSLFTNKQIDRILKYIQNSKTQKA